MPATPEPIEAQIRAVRATVRGFRESQLYIAFAELELGSAFDDGARTVQELAAVSRTDPAALHRFLDAAAAFGLVEQVESESFALTRLGRALYAPSSGTSLNNALKLEGAFYRRWGRLAEGVRSGSRPEANRAQEDDPNWVRMFTLALFENARSATRAVATTLDRILPETHSDRLHVLDLGGGHGGYSLALSDRRPDARITVFDLPPVIEVTSELVEMHNKNNRVSVVAGDFHKDPVGSNFDAVMLFGVLHGETPENAPRLLEIIREALKPEGLLLIRSQGRSTDRKTSGERELTDLHMLLSTAGGQVRRSQDTQELVTSSGFILRENVDIESPGSGAILVFERK